MMKTAENYIREDLGIDYPKADTINGSWFAENGLPMIVECTCCGMTMALPSTMINEEGRIYCSSCAEG